MRPSFDFPRVSLRFSLQFLPAFPRGCIVNTSKGRRQSRNAPGRNYLVRKAHGGRPLRGRNWDASGGRCRCATALSLLSRFNLFGCRWNLNWIRIEMDDERLYLLFNVILIVIVKSLPNYLAMQIIVYFWTLHNIKLPSAILWKIIR